jgi:hypothetical protein
VQHILDVCYVVGILFAACAGEALTLRWHIDRIATACDDKGKQGLAVTKAVSNAQEHIFRSNHDEVNENWFSSQWFNVYLRTPKLRAGSAWNGCGLALANQSTVIDVVGSGTYLY